MEKKDIFLSIGIAIFISIFLFQGGIIPRVFSIDKSNFIDLAINNDISSEALKEKHANEDAAIREHCKAFYSKNIESRISQPRAVVIDAENSVESGMCDDIFKCVGQCLSSFVCKSTEGSTPSGTDVQVDCLSQKHQCLIDCGK